MKLKVKICGMREQANVAALSAIAPDMMGFIFYAPSPRSVSQEGLGLVLSEVKKNIQKVAVFVNESLKEVLRICNEYGFEAVQLHGQEPAEYCRSLRASGLYVIKAFAMDASFDFNRLAPYVDSVELFLFDSPTAQHGGSGEQFDWEVLRMYNTPMPYFLSGGISPSDVEQIASLNLPYLQGIDANSRLEISPGLKDLDLSKTLIDMIRTL